MTQHNPIPILLSAAIKAHPKPHHAFILLETVVAISIFCFSLTTIALFFSHLSHHFQTCLSFKNHLIKAQTICDTMLAGQPIAENERITNTSFETHIQKTTYYVSENRYVEVLIDIP